ncbi:UNVERIFIED_CONTAM: hypothetical protein Slati_3476500 [Sesamum latifolium]|uniref:Uncharacterized protein n=1 Tax=Sesamum latifolium TaxID=2727402 RepID=A0AAW2UKG2_9LAMI
MLHMKDVYAVLDRHIRYAATKVFFSTKMTEGSFVQEHGIKMLSLVEKLEDLQARLDNDTYIDVILQSLPPSYDQFFINYNINGLEKPIHELITHVGPIRGDDQKVCAVSVCRVSFDL